jgi:hypothetical protein
VKVTGGAVTVEVTTLVAGAVAVMVVVAVVIEMQSGWVMVVVVVRRGSTGSGTEATKATAARWEKKNVKRCILTVIQVSHWWRKDGSDEITGGRLMQEQETGWCKYRRQADARKGGTQMAGWWKNREQVSDTYKWARKLGGGGSSGSDEDKNDERLVLGALSPR